MSARPGDPPTKPMLITLGYAIDEQGGRVDRHLYPRGQMRLILQGLLDRDLIDYVDPNEDTGPLFVTEAGRIAYATRPEGAQP